MIQCHRGLGQGESDSGTSAVQIESEHSGGPGTHYACGRHWADPAGGMTWRPIRTSPVDEIVREVVRKLVQPTCFPEQWR